MDKNQLRIRIAGFVEVAALDELANRNSTVLERLKKLDATWHLARELGIELGPDLPEQAGGGSWAILRKTHLE